MKGITKISILFLIIMFFTGCDSNKVKKIDIKPSQLTRVDVNSLTSGSHQMIVDEKSINLIRKAFLKAKWEKQINSAAIHPKKIATKATFYYKFDVNMPELLVQYFIWYDSKTEVILIHDTYNNSYGRFEGLNKNLRTILLVPSPN
jgi:hypothetical protein